MNRIPSDIICNSILPLLPASDVVRHRLIAKNWDRAYIDAVRPTDERMAPTLHLSQPPHGGRISSGFLLVNDNLQYNATEGLKVRWPAGRLGRIFAGRHPIILASSDGFLLLSLETPEERIIWNPATNEQRTTTPFPHGGPVQHALHVFSYDGAHTSFGYMLVNTYLPPQMNVAGMDVHHVGVMVFKSNSAEWREQDYDLPLTHDLWPDAPPLMQGLPNRFTPRAVVKIGHNIYFHVSRRHIIHFDADWTDDGDAYTIIVPVEAGHRQQNAILVCWQERPAMMYLHHNSGCIRVHVYSLTGDWEVTEVSLLPAVHKFRTEFRSVAYSLRSGAVGESSVHALAEAHVVGFVYPWYLVHQRDGYIRIFRSDAKVKGLKAKRVELEQYGGQFIAFVPFFSCGSSFLRLPALPDPQAGAALPGP